MCSRFEHIQGRHLSIGGHCGSLYQNIDNETVYYISLAEELVPSSISMIFKMLTEGSVEFNEYRGSDYKTVSAANKLFIFAVEEAEELCSEFKKAINYHCYLREYSISEKEILVEQRLNWANVNFVKEIPAIIAHNCKTISGCIRLLSLCFLIMRGDGRTNMIMEDVEKGIGLNASQELVPPPPVDTIPY